MADYQSWNYGGATYPLASATTNSLLQDADPALYYSIAYFQSVLSTYLNARIVAECAKSPAITQIASVVNSVVPYDPAAYLTERQTGFPMLAVYRTRDLKFEDRTIGYPHRVGEWMIQYVLPPLNAGQMERVGSILKAVGDVLHDRIETIFDPSFLAGAQVWKLAGIESIVLLSADFGRYEAGGDLTFPCWKAKLEVKERISANASTLALFTGADVATDLTSPQLPTLLDLVDTQYTVVDPTTIPGLVSLWRPDNGVALAADGLHVSGLADSFGSNLLSQATPANQPILVPGAVTDVAGRSKPVLRFDGSASFLVGTVASLANDAGRTIVALVRLSNTTQRSSIVAQTLSGDTGTRTLAIEANTASSIGGLMGVFADGSSYDSQAAATTTWRVVALTVSSTTNGVAIIGSTTFQVDNSAPQVLTNRAGGGTWQGMTTANQIALGAIPGIALTNASCDLGPVLIFNASLTTAQLTNAFTYCKQWAGLP